MNPKEEIEELIGKEKLLDWLLFIDNPDSDYAKLAENSDEVIGRAKDMLRTLSADEKTPGRISRKRKSHHGSLRFSESG